MTLPDVERIREETGRAARSFVDEEWLSHEEADGYETTRPLYRGYFAHAPLRLTLQTRGDRCVFHDPNRGCTLSSEARPRACLLYPFELLADGTWSVRPPRHGELDAARASQEACLAVEEAAGMQELQDAFGLTDERLDALAAQLRTDVAEHRKRR